VPLAACRTEIVESALAGPKQGFGEDESYSNLSAKTAVLAYRLIKGHACPDGNKRLALLLSSAFLEANGADLEASAEEIDHFFRQVAASPASDHEDVISALAHWFEDAMQPLPEGE
jgi:death-on-curing family protein